MTLAKPEEVKVKGTAFTSTMRFLEERHGAEGLEKVLAGLSQSDRELIKAGLADRRFYPFRILVQMMQISKGLHEAPPDYYRQMGRASADYAMSVFLKAIFKVASPEFVINQAAVFYGSFYTSGRVRVTSVAKGGCTLTLDKFDEPCTEFCHRVWGWSERILELAGARNIQSEKKSCLADGAPMCRFDATWNS